jgi:hypothetical protein
MRDNELYLYSGRPTLSIANGTVGGTGGTANVAGGTVDCIYTYDSGLNAWDQGFGFTPSGSLVVLPETGYYFLNAWESHGDATVAAEHVLRLYYGTALIAAQSYSSTSSGFGPSFALPIMHRCLNEVSQPGTVHATYRRGGSGTLTTWFGFQAVALRGL